MFGALLTPQQLLEEPKHASRAQSSVVIELYYLMIDGLRQQVGRVIVEQLIAPMLRYKFGELDDYGRWGFNPLDTGDLVALSTVYHNMAMAHTAYLEAGLMVPEADEMYQRDWAHEIFADAADVTPEQMIWKQMETVLAEGAQHAEETQPPYMGAGGVTPANTMTA